MDDIIDKIFNSTVADTKELQPQHIFEVLLEVILEAEKLQNFTPEQRKSTILGVINKIIDRSPQISEVDAVLLKTLMPRGIDILTYVGKEGYKEWTLLEKKCKCLYCFWR